MTRVHRAGPMREAFREALRAHPLLTLCLVGATVSYTGMFHELWTPNEPLNAAVGRAMWTSGTWVTPLLNGEPFLEKPPLFWWVQSSLFAAFDRATPFLARLPSALFGFATLLLAYALGRLFFSPLACLMAGLFLLSTALFSLTAHWIVVDNALMFAITGAWACFAHAETREGAPRFFLLSGMYVFMAMAFLAKGLIGLGIPLIGMSVYLLWGRRLAPFLGWHIVIGGGLITGVAALWLWLLWREGGWEALDAFLVYNHLGRFFPHQQEYRSGHVRPFWYYFANTPANLLPWTPFVALAGFSAWRHWERLQENHREGIRLCLAGTLPVFLALSLAGTKRGLYLLPVFPLFALLAGWWATYEGHRRIWENKLERWWEVVLLAGAAASVAVIFFDQSRWPYWLATVMVLLVVWSLLKFPAPESRDERLLGTVLLVCLAVANLWITADPLLDRYKSFVPFVRELERHVPEAAPLYAYRQDDTTIAIVEFYTGRHVTVVDLQELKDMAGRDATSWLVVRDARPTGGNYGRIQEAAISHQLLFEAVIGDQRTVRILAVGGRA